MIRFMRNAKTYFAASTQTRITAFTTQLHTKSDQSDLKQFFFSSKNYL